MGTLLAVPTETGDLAEIEVELLDEPVDGVAGFVGEDLDQVVSGEITGGLLGVGEAGVTERQLSEVEEGVRRLTIWQLNQGCPGPKKIAVSANGQLAGSLQGATKAQWPTRTD